MINNKEIYKNFCNKHPQIPLFSRPVWLDCVCNPQDWNVILIYEDNNIIASFPYVLKNKRIILPTLTQKLGPFLIYPQKQTLSSKIAYENKIITQIIEQLPNFEYFHQQFNHKIKNWLPFYWKNFKQTTRYSYIVDKNINQSQLFRNLSKTRREECRKANKILSIKELSDIELFYEINTYSFKDIPMPYTLSQIKKIYNTLKPLNQIKILAAYYHDEPISVSCMVWDEYYSYLIMNGNIPKFKKLNGNTLITWELLNESIKNKRHFDCMGSMMKGVEGFLRSFGSCPHSYFSIYKDKRHILQKIYEKFIKR